MRHGETGLGKINQIFETASVLGRAMDLYSRDDNSKTSRESKARDYTKGRAERIVTTEVDLGCPPPRAISVIFSLTEAPDGFRL